VICLGSLELKSNLVLSPLAGYTNLPFRLVLREIGGLGLATTDLVNARSLVESKSKALKLIETRPEDSPLAVQLFGSVPKEMREAAQRLESLGVAVVDINMGCPVRKVCRVGGGSAMMTDLDSTVRLVNSVVDGVKIPVTAKMRLGWDDENWTAPELASRLEEAGVAAITVHGRTREQGFSGPVKLAGIRAVAQAVQRIPVFGNGDVVSAQTAQMMFEQTGCSGISIGRGAFYNPWIFVHTQHFLATGQMLPEPTFQERIRVMARHLDLMVEIFGDNLGCRMFRKIGPWYSKRFGPCCEFKRQIVTISTRSDFDKLLAHFLSWRRQFLDENGDLLPKYRPPPLASTCLIDSPASGRIPVPKGPVALW
jgi:tRNA-dihydrouridine synthase B